MKKQQFKATIKAARNIVWHALWNEKNYRVWTSAFTEGSHAVSNWNEGSEILFLDLNGNGMYAVIEKKEEPAFMCFKHMGEIKNNEKQEKSSWAGATETYTLTEKGNETELVVEMDISEEYLDYFLKTWPVALEKLKTLAETDELKKITVEATVNAPAEKVWKYWTAPQHITQWNNASNDWHTPKAENDLRKGGNFSYVMAAKDGSFSFDFGGIYNTVKEKELIEYTIADGRNVQVTFTGSANETKVVETFEAESMNSVELQKTGWQAILDNFKKYTESN